MPTMSDLLAIQPPEYALIPSSYSRTKVPNPLQPQLLPWTTFREEVFGFPVPDSADEYAQPMFLQSPNFRLDKKVCAQTAFAVNMAHVAVQVFNSESRNSQMLASIRVGSCGGMQQDITIFKRRAIHIVGEQKSNSEGWSSINNRLILVFNDQQDDDHQIVARAVRQLFTYMSKTQSQFGFLSNYSCTWFFKRADENVHRTLLVSPCIQTSSTLTVSRCLWYLLHQNNNPDIEKPFDFSLIRYSSQISDPEPPTSASNDDDDNDSTYSESKEKSSGSANNTKSFAGKKRRRMILPALDANVISISGKSLLTHASFDCYNGILRRNDENSGNNNKQSQKGVFVLEGRADDVESVALIWESLESLQGVSVPKLITFGLFNGTTPILLFEPFEVVSDAEVFGLHSNKKAEILNILRKINRCGVDIVNANQIQIVRKTSSTTNQEYMLFGFGLCARNEIDKARINQVSNAFRKRLFLN